MRDANDEGTWGSASHCGLVGSSCGNHPPPAAWADGCPGASIVIPTVNEALNIGPLFERIDRAMVAYMYEVVVVDDGSTDGTLEQCNRLANIYPVRLFRRAAASGGLAGAILYGFSKARGAILVVMDADLQHPPECLPQLVDPLIDGEADVVLGSRYAPGGTIVSSWTVRRRLLSHVARLTCRPLIRGIEDPMSGYFALTRDAYVSSDPLDPIGFKIALEILCKCKSHRILEVPISFGRREHGISKLSIGQQRDYLRHLWRLYRYRCARGYRLTAAAANKRR